MISGELPKLTTQQLDELVHFHQKQDELALLSQQRACAAIAERKFKEEIIPIEVKNHKETVVVDIDEYPKADTTLEKLSRLKPLSWREER